MSKHPNASTKKLHLSAYRHRLRRTRIAGFRAWVGCMCLLLFVLSGCAKEQQVVTDPFMESWRLKALQSPGYSPPPIQHTFEPLARNQTPGSTVEVQPEPPEPPLPNDRITLKLHDAELPVLLRAMARAAGQNIIVNDKVQGKVSINVTDAPWNETFLSVMRAHGLVHVREGELLRILTLDDMEQDLRRQAQMEGLRLAQPLVTRVMRINYSEAQKLKESLDNMLTLNMEGRPLGTVMVDTHTNSIIIRSIGDDIERMVALVSELDRPTAQILIEAHIVETTQDTARELGVQWGALSKQGNSWIYPGSGAFGRTLGSGIDPTSAPAVNFPADLSEGVGMTIGYAYEQIGKTLLAVQLSALQEQGKLNILSSPSITTLENLVAIIESGEEVPFQTVEDKEVKIEFKKAVLRLEVTPHVIDGKALKLKISTNKDELDFTRTVFGTPTIITRRAETNVILFDGQTTVIGGLNQETNSKSQAGVPGVQDVPVLGHLFKSQARSKKMQEVLIFITPHILKQPGAQE